MRKIFNHLIALTSTSDLYLAVLFFMYLFYPYDLALYWKTAGDLSLVMINELFFGITGFLLATTLSTELEKPKSARIRIGLAIFILGLIYFIAITHSTQTLFPLKAYLALSISRFFIVLKGPSKETTERLILDNSLRLIIFLLSFPIASVIDFGSSNSILEYTGISQGKNIILFKVGLIYFSFMGFINYLLEYGRRNKIERTN